MGIHIQRTDILTGSGNPNDNHVVVEYQGQFYMDTANTSDVKMYYGVMNTNEWVSLNNTYLSADDFSFKVGPLEGELAPVGIVGGELAFTFKEDDYVKFGKPTDKDGNVIDGKIMLDSSKLTEELAKLKNGALDITRDKDDENKLLIVKPGQDTISLLLWYESTEQEMQDIIDSIPDLDLSNIESTGNILFNSMTRTEMHEHFNNVFGLKDE